jgi:hypothetical protein
VHRDLAFASTPTLTDLHLSCDNQNALKLAKIPQFHAKTKYIEGKHHFVRERVLEGEIQLKYVNTDDNPADLLTNPSPSTSLRSIDILLAFVLCKMYNMGKSTKTTHILATSTFHSDTGQEGISTPLQLLHCC